MLDEKTNNVKRRVLVEIEKNQKDINKLRNVINGYDKSLSFAPQSLQNIIFNNCSLEELLLAFLYPNFANKYTYDELYDISKTIIEKMRKDYQFDETGKYYLLHNDANEYKINTYKEVKELISINANVTLSIFNAFFDICRIRYMYTEFENQTKEVVRKSAIFSEFSKFVKANYDVGFNKLFEFLNSIFEKINDKKKDLKLSLSSYNKYSIFLNDLLKKLDSLSNITATEFEYYINNLDNDNIKNNLIDLMLEYKRSEKEDLEDKKRFLSQSSDALVIKLFKDNDLDFNSLDNNTKLKILNLNYEDIKYKFKILLYFKDINLISYLLINTSKTIISRIKELIDNNYLSLDFVISNKEYFADKKFDNIEEIIRLLDELNINPQIFLIDQSIYLIDFNLFKQNIAIINNYLLLSSLKNSNNFAYLRSDDLSKKIDILIELGYEEILENNMNLLNYDVQTLKRLYLVKEVYGDIKNIDELYDILNSKNYLVEDDKIDEYLFNEKILIPDDILKQLSSDANILKEYDRRSMVVSSSIVSIPRFSDNLRKIASSSCEEKMRKFYAIIYDGYYTFDEINNIAEYFNISLPNINVIKNRKQL